MPYLKAVLSMPRSLPLYGYTRISSDLNSVQRTPTFTKLLSMSRCTYFMPEIRSRFKKKQLPLYICIFLLYFCTCCPFIVPFFLFCALTCTNTYCIYANKRLNLKIPYYNPAFSYRKKVENCRHI